MLEPTTFPTARSGLPSCTAWRVTASSGADVAKATTVRPTTSGDMPIAAASPLAPRTRSSPPATRVTNPATSNPTVPMSMVADGSGRDRRFALQRRSAAGPSGADRPVEERKDVGSDLVAVGLVQ